MPESSQPRWVAEGRGHWSLWVVALAWIPFVLAAYVLDSHIGWGLSMVGRIFDTSNFPPASGRQVLEVLGGSLRIVVTVALVVGVIFAWGWRLRSWLGLEIEDAWVRTGFNFGLGVLLLNLFWVGAGLLRLWYAPLWMAVAALGLVFLVLDLFQCFKEKSYQALGNGFSREVAYLLLLVVGVLYFLFCVLIDLAPETFYDSMVYHLAVPSYWLMHHGLSDFPANFFSNYPFGAECYFLNGFVLQGTESAKMLHTVSFGVCALLAGGWAREIGHQKAGVLVLGLVLTFPLFVVNCWATQVEGFLALAILLFVHSLDRFIRVQPQSLSWALATGLFAGLAFSTKYTAFLFVGATLAIWLFKNPGFFKKVSWSHWVAFGLGVALLLGPWVLKNLVYTGNPCFPYLMSFFPGRHLPQAGYEQLLLEQHSRVADRWWEWLMLPWSLTMSTPNSYNFSGPLALAFIPLCLLFRVRHPVLRALAWSTPLLLVAGLAITHILRFIVPVFVLFYVLVGALVVSGDKPVLGKVTAWCGTLFALFCFVNLAAIEGYYYPAAGIWSGKETREHYLSGGPGKITPYYTMAQWIGKNLPPDAELLVAGDARGLYYTRPFFTNTVFDEQELAHMARASQDAEGVARRLKEMGVSYLVINGLEGMRVAADYKHYELKPEEWARLDEFMQRGTETVYARNLQEVRRILPAFKEWPEEDRPDLLMFFSKQGTQYVHDVQDQKLEETRKDLQDIFELYPFSRFWKKQKSNFEKAVKASKPS